MPKNNRWIDSITFSKLQNTFLCFPLMWLSICFQKASPSYCHRRADPRTRAECLKDSLAIHRLGGRKFGRKPWPVWSPRDICRHMPSGSTVLLARFCPPFYQASRTRLFFLHQTCPKWPRRQGPMHKRQVSRRWYNNSSHLINYISQLMHHNKPNLDIHTKHTHASPPALWLQYTLHCTSLRRMSHHRLRIQKEIGDLGDRVG